MPRFRKGAATSPLLPAHGASSLGLSRKKSAPSSVWASIGEAGLALVIAGALFAAIIYCLMSLEARRSAALDSRPSRELPGTPTPTKNAALLQRLDALIEEATKVAQEQGILTEVDAAENARLRKSMKEEDWSWILDDNNTNTLEEGENALQQLTGGQCSIDTKECNPHGVCISSECSCAVAFSGTFCGHSVLLSHPYTPDEVNIAPLGYEGDIILLQGSKLEAETKETVRQSEIFNGEIFESCAVVGDSGSLLLSDTYGAAIDSHPLVFKTGELRLGPSDSKEDYTQYRGGGRQESNNSVVVVYLVDHLPEKKLELEKEAKIVLTLPSSQNIERLRSYSAATQQQTLVRILDPGFVQHVDAAFGGGIFSNSSSERVLETSVLLALNTCRVVRVFGIAPLPGLPATYYDKCTPSLNQQQQQTPPLRSWLALKKYQEASLIEFGEACILECMENDNTSQDTCSTCRLKHDVDPEPLITAMKACP